MRLNEAVAERRGLQHDRRWMLVDESGQFLTQRELPEMALLQPSVGPDNLTVRHSRFPNQAVEIPLDITGLSPEKTSAKVWSNSVSALIMPSGINQWFSEVLRAPVRLVYMPDTSRRRADGRYAPAGQLVSFADGFPYLIIGAAALNELNRQLTEPVPMNRFRPNIVFTGGNSHDEDRWSDLHIGNQPFRCVKPCARCVMVTTDQATAQKSAEPLKTLSQYRRRGNKVLFGQNMIWTGTEPACMREGDILVPG
ncbi:MAG: MOSC domain-containing protein [Saprospiraceae bacterium]|nr:MOSC domain-containing protein [Saprospiraceae bacterium]